MAKKKKKKVEYEVSTGRKPSGNPYIDIMDSGGGRPIKLISELGKEFITKMAGIMCTDEEIAALMSDEHEHISVDTLLNENNKATFTECKAKGQATGKASLRRNQFALSKFNANMAIFLGKNYLDQTDKKEVKADVDGGDIVFNIMPASQRPPEDEEEV